MGLPYVYLGYWIEGSQEDGLQGPLPAAAAAGPVRLDGAWTRPARRVPSEPLEIRLNRTTLSNSSFRFSVTMMPATIHATAAT